MADQQHNQMTESWIMLLYALIVSRSRKLILDLEEELRNGNRFFPHTEVPDVIDELVPLSGRVMSAGTKLYRSRTIDRYREQEFTKPITDAFDKNVGAVFTGPIEHPFATFGYRYIEDAMCYCVGAVGIRDRSDDISRIKDGLMADLKLLSEDLWWGYGCDDIDAPPLVTTGGRAHPRGIRYLYTSDNPKTCLLEVRPVPSQMAGVAEIELTSDVKLFDISRECALESAKDKPNLRLHPSVLAELYSQPNFGGPDGYLTTQYISEYIKNIRDDGGEKMFDGVCFNSSLDPNGLNVVLFDTSIGGRKYRINHSALCQVMNLNGDYSVILPLDEECLSILQSLVDINEQDYTNAAKTVASDSGQ